MERGVDRMAEIVVLTGGSGGTKLVQGMADVVGQRNLSVIANVGDNMWIYSLYVCPYLDTAMYALAGLLSEERRWGIEGDSFAFMEMLRKYGWESWFNLGDRDLATHVIRTHLIRQGWRLSEVTNFLRRKLGVESRILPATDDPLETWVSTDAGDMHFQQYLVKHGAKPRVVGVEYRGSESAKPAPEVVEAIEGAKLVVVAPSNPLVSIGPILSIQKVSIALKQTKAKVVAVSPLRGGEAFSGILSKMLKDLGITPSPTWVAERYSSFLDLFLVDEGDEKAVEEIESLGVRVLPTKISLNTPSERRSLARFILSICGVKT